MREEETGTEFKDVAAAINTRLTELGEQGKETAAKAESVRLELEKVKALAGCNSIQTTEQIEPFGTKSAGWRTPGRRLTGWLQKSRDDAESQSTEDRARRMLREPGHLRLGVGSFFPTRSEREELEAKTTITSATVGSSTPGILTPERVRYVPAAQRRLTLRDVIPSAPQETGSAAEFPKENAFTNAASPQVEGSAKDESALTFTIASEQIRTLAHWIPASNQVLADWADLQRIIDSKLLYGLKLKEEAEILNGSGTGQHLNGLVTQATPYAGTRDAAGDTRLDKLLHAKLELEELDEQPDFAVVSPVTWHDIQLIKDQASNVGNYVAGDPLGGVLVAPVLWNLKLIVSNSMAANDFLVGESMQAEIRDRQEANIMVSNSHDNFFVENKVAIRCEERVALCVFRPGAFVYGSFS